MFSILIKAGDTRAELYRPHVKGKLTAISFVTVGELLYWTSKKNWGPRRIAALNDKLQRVVTVPYDMEICRTYASLKAKLSDTGKCVADNDLWIAACAVRHSLPLITNNRKHFEIIPGLIIRSEAPIIKQLESQAKFFDEETVEESTPSSEPKPPS